LIVLANKPPKRKGAFLMLKMPESGQDHRHAALVAKVYGFLVFDGTSGLYHGPNAGIVGNFHTIGEGEKGIGGHGSAFY
jgi:hypothetical protein